MSIDDPTTDGYDGAPRRTRWLWRAVRLLVTVLVLGGGAWISFYWMTHRPTAQRRAPQQEARLVEVSPIRIETHTVSIDAMGTVVPARAVQLASQVGGRIVWVSPEFVPGGRFEAGAELLRIERMDFDLTIRQRESALAQAQANLRIEMGQQSVALREYELLGEEIGEEDRELVLREPQRATAEAAVTAAQASLDQARLDRERTTVHAPFNCLVVSRSAELGSQVSAGATLASLVGTDEYWLDTSVPADELRWIRIPGYNDTQASEVEVHHDAAWGPGASRTGAVLRLRSELETEGRMARLLISVADPLHVAEAGEQRLPLILASYVSVRITGRELPAVARVPRAALRDGARAWLMADDGSLEIRDVSIAWQSRDDVYVSEGLADGEMLVTSDLAAPVAGMALRVPGSDMPKPRTQGAPPAGAEPKEADNGE